MSGKFGGIVGGIVCTKMELYPHMSLNVTQIKALQPRQKSYKKTDGEGLFLFVTTKGKKYWRLKYRFRGKEKTLSLGEFPHVGLANARAFKVEAKGMLVQGLDPSVEKQRRERETIEDTFESVSREWWGIRRGMWKDRHADKVLESMEREVFPHIGQDDIKKLTPPEILAVIRRIESRGALEIAARVLGRIRNVFKYAIQTGRALSNPATDLVGTIKTRKVKHMTTMKSEELPEFLKDLDHYQGSIITRLAIEFTLLTFVRTNEIRFAEWSEFNMDKREWVIPSERMKMKREHIVPLSDQALKVLSQLESLTGRYKLVFPQERRTKNPISNNTMLYGLYRMGWKNRTTVHGFRSLASTVLNGSGFNPDAIEAALAHVDANKVRSAYNRSLYLPERVEIMQWWSDYVDGCRAGGNVVPFRKSG